jgi:hypothetical protein
MVCERKCRSLATRTEAAGDAAGGDGGEGSLIAQRCKRVSLWASGLPSVRKGVSNELDGQE